MAPESTLPLHALLRTAYNTLAAGIYNGVVAGGEYDDLRPAHGNVMEQLELEDGVRLTDLAARAGITAQSMGELVDDLEARGYVERRPDPSDRRAKRIYMTERGRINTDTARNVTLGIERRVMDILGPERFHQLRQTLIDVIALRDDGAR